MRPLVAIWLTWQISMMSMLIVTVFLSYRHYVRSAVIHQRVELISGLLVTWASYWGRSNDEVREALDQVIRSLRGDKK